jgi:hypothetical protein
MRFLCRKKISIHSATPSYFYPVVRLPRELAALAGKTAHIYQTENDENLAFFITVDKSVDKICANLDHNEVDNHLSAIESQITELKSLILENEKLLQNISKKEAPESGFEPESEPRQGSMIGRYTTRACISAVTA